MVAALYRVNKSFSLILIFVEEKIFFGWVIRPDILYAFVDIPFVLKLL